MWELDHKESWGRRINAFELWCWRRLLRVLDCKEIHPVNPKEIIPEYSLEGLMLKLQYFGHLIWRADSLQRPWCWERLKVGAEGDGRRWAGCMASPIWWTWVWVSSRSWWWIGKPECCSPEGCRVRHDWVTELNWPSAPCGSSPEHSS